MLFHAAITNFRKDIQLPFFNFRRAFTSRACAAEVATQPLQHRLRRKRRSLRPTQASNVLEREPDDRLSRLPRVNPGEVDFKSDLPPSFSKKGASLPQQPIAARYFKSKRYRPDPFATYAVPSTKWELVQRIRRLLSFSPAAPFSRLLSIHGHYPALQSVESYNLLLHLSIRHGFSRRTRFLIKSMATNLIQPDLETEKLVVRYLVSSGYWTQAWQQTMTRHSSVVDIPIPVLLEFLVPGSRDYARPKRVPPERPPQSHLRSPALASSHVQKRSFDGSQPTPEIPLDTLLLILHRFPALPLHELAKLPARVVSYAVRGLIRSGQEAPALVITENHLKSLPRSLSIRRLNFARDLVHLHLSSGELKLANYKRRRRLVENLFSLHPGLYPNAKTVHLLMRYMEPSNRCGIEAYLFFKNYRARWGVVVDSLDVRRRIVQYALKQRKHGIAKEISMLDPLEEPVEQIPRPRSVSAWRSMYPQKGRSRRYWKRVFIRLLGRRRVGMRIRKRTTATTHAPRLLSTG